MKTKLLISTLLIGSLTFSVQAQKASNYKIVNKIHLEGDGKWDYLFSDDEASRLYVSHQTMVQVVDETNGQVIGKITGMNGVHGIAIVSGLNKGYISSGKDTMITVFDTKTLNVITRLTASGVGPDAIFYDPYSKKIFTCNGKGHCSSVIDPETDKIIATIELNGKPESGVSDGNGKVYVNFEKESQLCEINSATFKVENVWPLAPGEGPSGLTLDNETHRLFSACDNKMMMILDAKTGKIVTSVPIGENVDGDAFDPGLKVAYTSNGEGTMTVIEEDTKDSFGVAENFPTQRGAKTITVNRKTHHIYMSTADLKGADDDDDSPHAKPKIVPGTFVVLDIAPVK
jgi:DNA-binding beta-propeller fold protein YncE